VTCVPFATIVVGRFASLAPAIWLYAGVTILMSAVSFRMLNLTPEIERADHSRDRHISLAVLMASSPLAIAWSFVSPHQALWALAINFALPVVSRRKSLQG